MSSSSQDTPKQIKAMKFNPAFDSKAVFKRLFGYLGRHKEITVIAVIFMIITALTEASFAYLMKHIVNDGFVNASEWHLKWLGIILASVAIFRGVVGYFANYFTARLGRTVIFDLRQDIFSNLITLPTAFYSRNSSSKNVSKLIYDVEATAVATTETLAVVFLDGVKSIGLIAQLIYLDWRLTMIFIIVMPLLVLATRYTNSRFRLTTKQIQDSIGGIADTVKEASIGQKVIKAYGGQQQELENFGHANQNNLKQNLKRARVSAAVVPVTIILVAPAVALILHIYLNFMRTGPEAAGEFTAYLTACMLLMGPLKRIAKINEKIQIGLTAANSVFEVVDAGSELDDGDITLKRSSGSLKFDRVDFTYTEEEGSEGEDQAVLKNISFELKPGKRVALVGPSGSGKSTLTSLILRFHKPQTGKVTLDGYDINQLVLSDLRNQVALVSQETTLFDDTIRRNIMYGMLDQFDQQRLDEAIKTAHVDEFVDLLPEGLNTVVGEHGLRLSGGQRQRIAIARAIYKNAPILILDEATSALDNKSERYVQEALETLMQGRTSLVIAHRLSTIESADEILVLDQGQIVERGSHKKLLKKKGIYSQLHSASGKSKRGLFFFNKK